MADLGDSIENAKKKGAELSTGFLSVFADAANSAFKYLNIDAAATGKAVGESMIDSIAGTINPALSIIPKTFREYMSQSEADMKKVADAAAPIAEIGEKFNSSLLSAAQRLQGALGSSSIVDSLLGPPDDSWTKPRKPSMLDIGNYDPTWDDVSFEEQNQRTKNVATAERLARIRQQSEEEWQRKLRESTENLSESFSGLSAIGEQLQQALGPNYSNRSVGNVTASVGEQERKSRGTGASFDGAFKSGENSSGAAMNQGVSGYGFWPDGTPKTSEEFSSGKRDALSHEDDHSGTKAKQQAASRNGQKENDPLAALARDVATIREKVDLIEPKLPQQVLS